MFVFIFEFFNVHIEITNTMCWRTLSDAIIFLNDEAVFCHMQIKLDII